MCLWKLGAVLHLQSLTPSLSECRLICPLWIKLCQNWSYATEQSRSSQPGEKDKAKLPKVNPVDAYRRFPTELTTQGQLCCIVRIWEECTILKWWNLIEPTLWLKKKVLNQSGESMLGVLHRTVLVEWTRKAKHIISILISLFIKICFGECNIPNQIFIWNNKHTLKTVVFSETHTYTR